MTKTRVCLSMEVEKFKKFKKFAIDLGITFSEFLTTAAVEKIEADTRKGDK